MPTDAGDTFNTSEDSMTDDTTITDSERDLLRFPACADILRRTTPITNATARGLPDDADDVYPTGALTGLVCGVMTERAIIAWDCCEQWDRVDFAGLALDLTDATGRAHLAWWIAIRIGGAAAMRGDLPLPQWAADFTGWSIYCGEAGTLMGATWEALCHPLDALDPDDPRLLPDGSRLVDALALSLVGRHLLAGGGR